jgi:hypothetical protein
LGALRRRRRGRRGRGVVGAAARALVLSRGGGF